MPADVMRVNDVMQRLDCSESQAYQIIRELNAQLKKQGYLTIAGRVPRNYFEKKCALTSEVKA